MAWVQSHCSPVLRAAAAPLLPLLLLLLPPAAQARQAGSGAASYQDDAHLGGGVEYAVPAPFIEALSPRGLRISIPDAAGVSQVRFHVAVNKALSAQRLGTVNVEVSHRTGAVWTYEDRTTVLRAGDILQYWLQVTRDGRDFERAGSHTVQDLVGVAVGLAPLSAPAAPPPPRRPAATPPPQPQPTQCARSQTSVNGRLVCRGELLFIENFDSLDDAGGSWRHDVLLAGQPDYEFTAFTKSVANTYTVNGQLVVRPTLTDDVYGKDFVRTGRLQLENCTAAAPELCSRQGKYGYILPPVLSGRISTRKSFSFRYGLLEIRAKLPSGDWLYPELWLLPREEAYGAGLRSGRVQLALARGNAALHLGATELGLRRLEAGALASPGPGAEPDGQDADLDAPNVVTFAATPPRAASTPPPTTARTTTTTRRPSTAAARTAATTRAATTRPPATSSTPRAGSQQRAGEAPTTGRASTTAAPRPDTTRTSPIPARTNGSPVRSAAAAAGSTSSGSAPVRSVALQAGGGHQGGHQGGRTTTAPSFMALWPDGGRDAGDSGWPRSDRRSRAARAARAAPASSSGYMGPSRKEVSRTELPGRLWSTSFHNYTLRWTPDEMVFSVDGVELGVLEPEATGGLLRSSARAEDDPWHAGGRMAPFDREFYISLGLAVGGIHNFPDGVEGPNGSRKPWKNTAAKAMLSFWNAKDQWYESWSTDSALLVDFVRVTAL